MTDPYLNKSPFAIKKILVAVDSGKVDLSMRLVKYAMHIAESEKQKLTDVSIAPSIVLINVIEEIKQGGAIGLQAKYGNYKIIDGFRGWKEESARRLVAPLEEAAKQRGLEIISVILPAQGKSLSKAISDYASQNQIDLIIIGAGDLFKLRYLLSGGSITSGIIKNCKCPVLLVN